MHVVGARFRSLAAASTALLAVRAAVTVAPGDVGVRPLGSTLYEMPAEDFLLAGRFADEDADVVVAIVAAHGGEVIERRRELPRPGAEARPHAPQRDASNPPLTAGWTGVSSPERRSGARRPCRAPTAPRQVVPAAKRLRRPAARLRVRAAHSNRID